MNIIQTIEKARLDTSLDAKNIVEEYDKILAEIEVLHNRFLAFHTKLECYAKES